MVERGCGLGKGEAAFIQAMKGCRCGKTGGQKLCGRGRKAGNEGCRVDMEARRQDYNQARGEAKRAIFKAKNDERKWFCENLERENDKGNLFRVAKQLVNRNRDVVGTNCMKDSVRKIVMEEDRLMEVWREHTMMCYQTRSLPGIERVLQMQGQCVGLVKGFRHWRWMLLLVRLAIDTRQV